MKPPRRSCVDQFLRISPSLRNEVFHVIENFHLSLGDRFDNVALASQVRTISLKMRDEMIMSGPLGGLLFDLNLYNLWTLLKNYKTKQRAELANRNACAFMAPFVTRFLVDRLLFTMDRIVWTAPCSGLVLPKRLACAIFRLAMDVRKKTAGNCKFSGCGRKQLMAFAKELAETFQSLEDVGALSPDVKRFFQLHCRFTNVDRLLTPVLDCCSGREPSLALLNSHWFQRKDQVRSASKTAAGPVAEASTTFDNPLLLTDEEGNLRTDVCDLSPLLPGHGTQTPAVGQLPRQIPAVPPGPTFIATQNLPPHVSLAGPITLLSRPCFSEVAVDSIPRGGVQAVVPGTSLVPTIVSDLNTTTMDAIPQYLGLPGPSQSLLQFLQTPLPVQIPPLSPPPLVQEVPLNLKRKSPDSLCAGPPPKITANGVPRCSPPPICPTVEQIPEANRSRPSLQPRALPVETRHWCQPAANSPIAGPIPSVSASPAGERTSEHPSGGTEAVSPGSQVDCCAGCARTQAEISPVSEPITPTSASTHTLPPLPNIMDLAEIENSGDFQPLPTDNLTLFSECDMSPSSCANLAIPTVNSVQQDGQSTRSSETLFLDSRDVLTEEEKNYIIDDELTQILYNLFESGASKTPTAS